jgi:hypothetical protein
LLIAQDRRGIGQQIVDEFTRAQRTAPHAGLCSSLIFEAVLGFPPTGMCETLCPF